MVLFLETTTLQTSHALVIAQEDVHSSKTTELFGIIGFHITGTATAVQISWRHVHIVLITFHLKSKEKSKFEDKSKSRVQATKGKEPHRQTSDRNSL